MSPLVDSSKDKHCLDTSFHRLLTPCCYIRIFTTGAADNSWEIQLSVTVQGCTTIVNHYTCFTCPGFLKHNIHIITLTRGVFYYYYQAVHLISLNAWRKGLELSLSELHHTHTHTTSSTVMLAVQCKLVGFSYIKLHFSSTKTAFI